MNTREISALRKLRLHGRGLGIHIIAVALFAAACGGGLRAIYQADSQSQWQASCELEKIGARVVWAWRLDERIQEVHVPCLRPPCWVVSGDSYVSGVVLLPDQGKDLKQRLAALRSLPQLRMLDCSSTEIDDSALECLEALSHLERLDLHDTRITEAGLRHLPATGRLRWLSLRNMHITDAALPDLARKVKLTWLDISGTQITPAGAERLRVQLPEAQIVADMERMAIVLPPH